MIRPSNKTLAIAAVGLTLLTTIGWLIRGVSVERARRDLLISARSFAARGDFDGAIATLNQVGHEGEVGFQAILLSGEYLVRSGRLQEAATVLSYAVDRQPNSATAYRWLAACWYDLGAVPHAVSALVRLSELDQTDARPHRLLAKIYRDFKRLDDAITELEKAAELAAADPKIRSSVVQDLAEAYVEKGLYENARNALRPYDLSATASPRLLTLLAECSYAEHDVKMAIDLARRVLASDKDNHAALQLLGRICLENDVPGDAAELAARAVRLRPDDHKSRHVLAQAYRQLGRTEDAQREEEQADQTRQLFDRLTKLSKSAMDQPADALVRLELAKVWLELGRKDMASTWLRATLACDPNLREARELLNKLLPASIAPTAALRPSS